MDLSGFTWILVTVYDVNDLVHYHIAPIMDLRDHDAHPTCWCGPTEDLDDPGIWVHHAMDRRDEYERGRMKH